MTVVSKEDFKSETGIFVNLLRIMGFSPYFQLMVFYFTL